MAGGEKIVSGRYELGKSIFDSESQIGTNIVYVSLDKVGLKGFGMRVQRQIPDANIRTSGDTPAAISEFGLNLLQNHQTLLRTHSSEIVSSGISVTTSESIKISTPSVVGFGLFNIVSGEVRTNIVSPDSDYKKKAELLADVLLTQAQLGDKNWHSGAIVTEMKIDETEYKTTAGHLGHAESQDEMSALDALLSTVHLAKIIQNRGLELVDGSMVNAPIYSPADKKLIFLDIGSFGFKRRGSVNHEPILKDLLAAFSTKFGLETSESLISMLDDVNLRTDSQTDNWSSFMDLDHLRLISRFFLKPMEVNGKTWQEVLEYWGKVSSIPRVSDQVAHLARTRLFQNTSGSDTIRLNIDAYQDAINGGQTLFGRMISAASLLDLGKVREIHNELVAKVEQMKINRALLLPDLQQIIHIG